MSISNKFLCFFFSRNSTSLPIFRASIMVPENEHLDDVSDVRPFRNNIEVSNLQQVNDVIHPSLTQSTSAFIPVSGQKAPGRSNTPIKKQVRKDGFITTKKKKTTEQKYQKPSIERIDNLEINLLQGGAALDCDLDAIPEEPHQEPNNGLNNQQLTLTNGQSGTSQNITSNGIIEENGADHAYSRLVEGPYPMMQYVPQVQQNVYPCLPYYHPNSYAQTYPILVQGPYSFGHPTPIQQQYYTHSNGLQAAYGPGVTSPGLMNMRQYFSNYGPPVPVEQYATSETPSHSRLQSFGSYPF